MKKLRTDPRQTLASNLRALMAVTGLSGAEVARLSGISAKSVNNMLHGRHGANLDHVGQVAAVFGLNLWHLIVPDLPQDLARDGRLQSLVEHYTSASSEGRANIDRVAEMEARYNVKG